MTPILILAGIVGLVVGSFLNVVIYRVPREMSIIAPGSHCPNCQTEVKPWHNIPVVSWLVLRAKCAHCKEPISIRYPLVEAATGLLFVGITAHFGLSADLPAYLYFAAIAVALAMIDFDVCRLPDSIVVPSYVVAGLMFVPVIAWSGDWWTAARAVIGMCALLALYFSLAFLYPGGMGFGDVKLAGLLGLYLGWLSWSALLIGAFGGFLIGGFAGAALLATRRAPRRSAIPFGPHMLGAAVLAVFIAAPVATWYTSLIGQS